MRRHAAAWVAIAAGIGAAGASACLLTSDFDNIVGVRPAGEDGGDPGNPDGGGDAGGPCAAGDHLVCTDFDHTPARLPVPGWNHEIGDAGTLTIDQGTLRPKVAGPGEARAYLYRQVFTGTFSTLIATFDVRVIACPPQGNSLTLVYLGPGQGAAFGLVVLSSGVFAGGSKIGTQPDTFYPLEKQLPQNAWAHVVYRLEKKTATVAHINITVDGQRALDTDTASATFAQTATLNLGLLGGGAPQGCEVAFDNYLLDRE